MSDKNKKGTGSLIPVRCNINAVKKTYPQPKSSSQLTVPSENKQVQRGVTSSKTSKVSENIVHKSNRPPTTNAQTVEKLKSVENLKTEVKEAKRVQPKPQKLISKCTKPAPVHKRNLAFVNKDSKSHNVKTSRVQPEPLRINNKPAKPVLQRNISSVNAACKETKSYIVNKSKPKTQPMSKDFKSQNKNFQKTQSSGEGKLLKTGIESKQSKKDEVDIKNKTGGFHRAVDWKPSNAHKLPTLPSSMRSNKENLDTKVVEELKQITEKRKLKVKEEESHKIQPVSQNSEINKEFVSKNTESVLDPCIVEEKESKLVCPTKNDIVVSDSEFQNSKFYKSLILSERDRSPDLMTLVPEIKVSSFDDVSESPMNKFLKKYATNDDFLEDLKRNSTHFRKMKGLSPAVPGMKSSTQRYLESFPSVNDFVENLKRNSSILVRRRATLQGSPHLIGSHTSAKKFPARFTAETIVEELRRNSANFIKRREKLELNQLQNTPFSRRWTCNVQNNLVKMCPVVKEESRFQIHTKIGDSVRKNPSSLFNFAPSALKGGETSKKKNKSKKKVTFYISPPTNSSLCTSFSENLEKDNLKTTSLQIKEQPSRNSTPEFEANVYRNKDNPVVLENSMKTRNSSTPEFNLEALKILPISIPNASESDEKKQLHIDFTSKLDVEGLEFPNNKSSHDSKCEKAIFSSFQPIASSSNFKSPIKGFKSFLHSNQNSIHCKIADDKNKVKENVHCSFSREGQTAIIKPMQQLSICSSYINETGPFSVKTGNFTPHSISSYSNSYLVNSLSPPILVDRPSILASYATICTPLVFKNVTQTSDLNHVRQKLDFEEAKLERRESQICLQDVPTLQKMYDYLCDQECCMLSSLTPEACVTNRNVSNPIADILSNGDEMHFVPLDLCETPISS